MDGDALVGRVPVNRTESRALRMESLFDAHQGRLYRLARRLTSSADDALDLVQETFLRAARAQKLPAAGDSSAEEAWLVRILVNIRRDQWRKSEVRKRRNRTAEDALAPGLTRPSPEAALIAKATVWRALELLPPRRRAVVVMHEIDGTPVPTIASLLGIGAITVRWHLSRGLRELNRALADLLGDKK
jgi:RNA polymerase sigma-70 factor (ECF subfamily)